MKPRFWLRLIAFAVVLGLLGSTRPAWACSCMQPPPPPQALQEASAVFAGRVTGIHNPSQVPILPQVASWWATWTNSPSLYTVYNQQVTFAVSDSWKGVSTTTVTVQTSDNSASCGFLFNTGQQYVVYAHDFQGAGLETNICTRTADAANAAADLAYLNTLPRLTLNPAASSVWPYAAGAVLVVALLAGGAAWFVYRRRAADEADQ